MTRKALTAVCGVQVVDPPYRIANGNTELSLNTKTASVASSHHDGTLEYDAHNIYGLTEAIATAPAVANITGARPFVLTRWLRPAVQAHLPAFGLLDAQAHRFA